MKCLDTLSLSLILCSPSAMSAIAALVSAFSALFLIFITYKIYKWNSSDKLRENEQAHYFDYVVVYSMNIIDERRPELERLVEELEGLHKKSRVSTTSLRGKIDEIQNCYGTYEQKIFNRLNVFDASLAQQFKLFFEKKKDALTIKLQQFSLSLPATALDKNEFLNIFDEVTSALKSKKFD